MNKAPLTPRAAHVGPLPQGERGRKRRAALNDEAAVAALFDQHREWAERIGTWYARKLPEHVRLKDELVNAALMGLWDAAKQFDQAKGLKFKTFSTKRVQGEVLDFLRGSSFQDSRTKKRWQQAGWQVPNEVTIDKPMDGQSGKSIASNLEDTSDGARLALTEIEDEGRVKQILGWLSPRERYVVRRYVLDGEPFWRIGEEIERTESGVAHLYWYAVGKLRVKLEKEGRDEQQRRDDRRGTGPLGTRGRGGAAGRGDSAQGAA